jgi:hypothetical protein
VKSQELETWRTDAVTIPATPPGGLAGATTPAGAPATVRAAPSLRAKLIFFFVLLVLAVAAVGIFITILFTLSQ